MKHFSIYNQVFSMSLSQHCIVLHFILKDGNVVFFPACIFLYKKKQIPVSVWISVFVFNFVLLINMSIFISIHCSFFFTITLQQNLRSGVVIVLEVLSLFKSILAIQVLYVFVCFHLKQYFLILVNMIMLRNHMCGRDNSVVNLFTLPLNHEKLIPGTLVLGNYCI